MQKGTLPGVATGTALGPGAVVSGRFKIDGLSTLLGQVVVYAAKDQKTQRPISLWAVPPGLLRPEMVNATRAAVKGATSVSSKDLVVPFGSSTDPSGTLFIATEPMGATSVSELIEKKRKEGHVHGLSAAYQLLGSAMNGLTAAHASMSHGAPTPSLLRIDAQGHLKLAGLGMVSALIAAGVVPAHYLAPEVRRGETPTVRSDVYSMGAILYELVTGKPADASVSASSVVPGLPATLDIILENCLADSPADRFQTIAEMKGALASLVAPSAAPPPPSEGLDIPIEFDFEGDVKAAVAAAPTGPAGPSRRPPPNAPAPAPAPAARPAMPPPSAAPAPVVGRGPAAVAPSAVSVLDSPGSSGSAPPQSQPVDLRALLDEATSNDASRWMYVRGGLDHGPLSARELIQSIVRGDVTDQDMVVNTDTGDRRKLRQWPQFAEFADQALEKRRVEQHKRDVKNAIAEDTSSAKAKVAVAVALVLVVGGIGLAYYKTLGPGRSEARKLAELDDALAHGQLHLNEGGLQVLEAPTAAGPGGGGGGHRAGGGGGGGGGGSYESAMNQAVDYNFGGGGAGGPSSAGLTTSQISAPLNRALGRFGSCATAEIARGGTARSVTMRIAIGGDGSPIGVSVGSGSPAFKSCVSGVVHGLHWPAFGGPRLGFAWGFSLE